MKVKGVIDEDFVNYKQCSMFIAFPTCKWKCGRGLCQNSSLALSPDIEIDPLVLVDRFINNPLTDAIVCGGLEPMDSFRELCLFLKYLRYKSDAAVVIYTGYERPEIKHEIMYLETVPNIIVKFGRYRPNQTSHFDEVLGVYLQSDNQYGEVIS